MRKLLTLASIVFALTVGPASAASCADMFTKAEQMVAQKTSLSTEKRVAAFQMAIGGYNMCTKGLAMADGTERTAMLKDAEREFKKAYRYIDEIE
ncbi:MAG: hypothetical protein OEU46_14040 [Alphaproteobacteria bacterium]|nr:hypothetical protein [Alphaproteobacteria bacterium]